MFDHISLWNVLGISMFLFLLCKWKSIRGMIYEYRTPVPTLLGVTLEKIRRLDWHVVYNAERGVHVFCAADELQRALAHPLPGNYGNTRAWISYILDGCVVTTDSEMRKLLLTHLVYAFVCVTEDRDSIHEPTPDERWAMRTGHFRECILRAVLRKDARVYVSTFKPLLQHLLAGTVEKKRGAVTIYHFPHTVRLDYAVMLMFPNKRAVRE